MYDPGSDMSGIFIRLCILCKKISEMKPVSELHFASEPSGTGVRLILSGSPSDVMGLIDQYYAQGN